MPWPIPPRRRFRRASTKTGRVRRSTRLPPPNILIRASTLSLRPSRNSAASTWARAARKPARWRSFHDFPSPLAHCLSPAPRRCHMSQLGKIADSIDAYNSHVAAEVKRARTDPKFADELRAKWTQLRASVETTRSPTGTLLPRLALPDTDEPGAIAEYLLGQGFPGQFPYATAAYREMYLDSAAQRA